jgi:hypothetical protein
MNQTTMSPVTFKRQVEQVIAQLGKCVQLCKDIRTNRHMKSTENLNKLQNAFESAEQRIPMDYAEMRRIAGSEFDSGDGKLPPIITLEFAKS